MDATDKRLGRLASTVAIHIRGKNMPTYTPSTDMGAYVIIVCFYSVTIALVFFYNTQLVDIANRFCQSFSNWTRTLQGVCYEFQRHSEAYVFQCGKLDFMWKATGFDCSWFWLGKVWTLCRWMLRKWQLQARKGHRSSTGGTLAGLVGWLRRLLSHCSAEFLNELLSMQCGECYQKGGWASLSFCHSFILCTNGYVSAD